MEYPRRNLDTYFMSVSVDGGVSHVHDEFSTVGWALGSVVEEHCLDLSNRTVPPIGLYVVIVPRFYDVPLHLAVTPLTKYAADEQVIGRANHLPKKTAGILVRLEVFYDDTDDLVVRR